MSNFILYNYYRSSTSYRVRIALNLKNIPFDYKSVHLLKNGGEQHFLDYKKLNPLEEVPTLVHNGKSIAQSLAVIEYLEEIQPQPTLFPNNAYSKAKIRQFCENINSFLHPLSNLKVLQKLESDLQYTSEQKNAWVQYWYGKGFQALEEMLIQFSGKYCFGDQITAADVLLVPCVFTAKRFQVNLDPFPLCRKVNDECLKHSAFAKAHPGQQPDTPESEKKSSS